MPTRPSNSHDPVRIGPLDPNGVIAVKLDLSQWLEGESVVNQAFTLPTELDSGDGATVFSDSPAGNVTPPGPTVVNDVLTFYLFKKSGESLDVGLDYTVTVHYITVTRADDVTVITKVRER